MTETAKLKLAWFGDDFTGSTDSLELLAQTGIRSVLFLRTPQASDLERFPDVEAIGLAGTTRSMAPASMEEALQPVLALVGKLKPRHFHYKVCSTFDSSPETGSIGKAIDTISARFPGRLVPVLVGIPDLGRYCVFGNLFARMGTVSTGEIHRIDRHPSMRNHPVTPAMESDLRRVLAGQTDRDCVVFDILHCRQDRESGHRHLEELLSGRQAPVVIFDTLEEADMKLPGELLEAEAVEGATLFSVGSSAVEMALLKAWGRKMQTTGEPGSAGGNPPLLALSGSCSPVTRNQIHLAAQAGFAEIALETGRIFNGQPDNAVQSAVEKGGELLTQGESVIIHTHTTREPGMPNREDQAELLGTALGKIARQLAEDTGLQRILVAGGDTSGFAAAAMDIDALTFSQPLARGAPLCQIRAPGNPLDGKEINFKGGQVGSPDYFVKAAQLQSPKPGSS